MVVTYVCKENGRSQEMSNDDDDMIGTHPLQNDFMSYLIGLFPKLKWVGKGGCTANFFER